MWEYVISSAAGFLAGTAGAMGLGGGSILLLYLTLFANVEQLRAQGINLIFFIPCALAALWLHHREGRVEWRIVLPSAVYGIIGAAAGYWLGGFIGGEWLGKVFGVFLLALGARELLHRRQSSEAVSTADGVGEESDVGRIDRK